MPLIHAATTLLLLLLAALLGSQLESGRVLIGVIVPYGALLIFVGGFCWRVYLWASSPVPFRIPVTCGQQKSLPWIKSAPLDNPASGAGVVGRVLLEALFFRSLLRNNRAEIYQGRTLFGESKLLWLAAMGFHGALLVIILRHLRLLLEKVPAFTVTLATLDSFLQAGLPPIYLTNVIITVSLAYLIARRWTNPLLSYISQFSDYFATLLIFSIIASGMLMRYGLRMDLVAVKQYALGMVTLHPVPPPAAGGIFYLHILLIAVLAAFFPFSKLMHMGAMFLSPTRNMANNSRNRRHINPWNYPVKTHPYHEWEDEFRDKLKMAGIPLDEEKDVRPETADKK